jgi:DNA polymerase-3 subunit delta'
VAKKPKSPAVTSVPPPKGPTISIPVPLPYGRIVGHEQPLSLLNTAIRSERIHHAWIFHGPQGVGKFTAALSFASLLLDPTTQATFDGRFEADPESEAQRLMNAGTHPDLHVIVKELARFHEDARVRDKKLTTIPIDVLRRFVLAPALLAPSQRTQSRAGKVFIIDEAHLLNHAGQNALLKILEEPPQRVVLILVTSSEDELLPTIRSRSQRVYFSPLTPPEMAHWVASSGRPPAPQDEADFLAGFSGGSPGVYTEAQASGIYLWWQRIEPMLREAAAGNYVLELGPAMAELVSAWAEKWVKDHQNASKEAANVAAAEWMFRLVGHSIRAGLHTGARRSPPQVRVPLRMLDALREAQAEADGHVNAAFVMDKLAAELATH